MKYGLIFLILFSFGCSKKADSLSEIKAQGEKFLAENKLKEGIITLPSGLQYKVLASGSGATPNPSSQVTTHYRGTLINGLEFDSSYNRGVPATFGVSDVIAGWTEALLTMKVGDKRQLFIPAVLAYGDRSPSPDIPPGSTLIFEIELLGVN
jgi:FKBP-type peptidyl-prolyl cis-trans isomerase FklB